MKGIAMFKAQVDQEANLLTVSCTGRVGPDEAGSAVDQLPALLDKLKPGFRLLTDLSGLEAMDLACVPHMERLMDLCNERGVKTVVRVIPDPHKDIGLNILSLFHYRRRVRIVTCETLAEAHKVLEG
jgi:hypothetical protein